MMYFRDGHDQTSDERDRLLPGAIEMVTAMQDGYTPPSRPVAKLADAALADKMADFMQQGVERGDFMPHDKTVAMNIASAMLRGEGDSETADENDLYARERRLSSIWPKPRRHWSASPPCWMMARPYETK